MKKIIIALLLINIQFISNAQKEENKLYLQKKVSRIDFLKYLGQIDAKDKDTTGLLLMSSTNRLNDAGFGKPKIGYMPMYLIHKNGGNNWYKLSQKRYKEIDSFDKKTNYGYLNAAKRLVKEDKGQLVDFNKWVFFTDVKYLSVADIQDGDNPNPNILNYDLKPNIKVEIILYEQKAGSLEWIETDKKVCLTDKERNCNTYGWENNFIKQKVKESNQISNKK